MELSHNMRTDTKKTRIGIKDGILLAIAAVSVALISSVLFYRQAVHYNGVYISDLPTHIEQSLTIENYSLTSKLIKWVYHLSGGSNYSVPLLEGCTFGLSWLCAALTMEKLSKLRLWICGTISAFLLFLTNIYVPVLFPRFYMGSIISQPWHNITYSSMRPFAILTVLFFSDLYTVYRTEKRISLKYWALTCAALLLSTMMKPNFLMGFAPALLVILIIDFFGKRNTFKNEFLLGCVVLPACAVLPIQAVLLFSEEENGMIFGPSIFFFTEGPVIFIMKFITALTLPAIVYFFNRKRLLKGADIVALSYLWALLEGMFIMEKGFRQTHGNLLWGYEICGYVLFMYTVPMLIMNIRDYFKGDLPKTAGNRAYLIAGSLLTVLHMVTGVIYIIWVFRGNLYYI